MFCFAVTVDRHNHTVFAIEQGDIDVARTTAKQTSQHMITRQENVMGKIQGGCLCGAIRYQSTSEPTKLAVSDCRHCQKQSGAALAISVGVPGETFNVKGLVPSVYEDIRSSGTVVLRSFCPECGTPLFSESESEPTMVLVKAATLDDPSWVESQVASNAAKHRQGNQSVAGHRHSPKVLEFPAPDLRLTVS